MSRRSQAPGPASSAPEDDGLDEAVWEVLSGVIVAAGVGDANAHAEVFRRWPADAPLEGRRASLYLWFLLRYRIAEVLGRRPTPEDLHELATQVYPSFAQLIRRDEDQLELIFRTVFENADAEDHLKGSVFLILGTAALGALLDNPAGDLATMRPHLSDWWQRSAGEFRQLGVK